MYQRYNVLIRDTYNLDDYPAECIRKRMDVDCKIVSHNNGRSGGLIMLMEERNSDSANYVSSKIY
jgi:hypothetical protein